MLDPELVAEDPRVDEVAAVADRLEVEVRAEPVVAEVPDWVEPLED